MKASSEVDHSLTPAKATILLVDDEPMVLKMLQTFLESQGYQIICATGGQEALNIIEQQQHTVDLLITDIRMPDMNGIRLLEAVRQLLPNLPVLLMTGYTDFELVVEGLKQHAFDLLFKPIDFDQLTWCISKALAFLMTQRMEQQYRSRLEEQVAKQTKQLCNQLEALQEAQRKASHVDELKREFLSLISHEFRTPLNGIMGIIQLMEDQQTPVNQTEYLALLKTSAERITTLVNNLLTLIEARSAKHSTGDIMNTPCGALESLKKRYHAMAADAGIRFETNCRQHGAIPLYGPWDALHIITGCLLDNAFKFTGRGGVVSCHLWAEPSKTEQQETSVLIQVTDNGKGIPLACQEIIFQPFTQLEHYLTRRNEGSGVGLAIVRTICDKLGGKLTLESSPEHGSTFTCCLSFKKAMEPAP
ncbi:MAG: hybrid sensor histidine kinase/response regulator [Trichlorobacter sp.]|uniref:ATP-binding response regulator n=1 Tax=Trichlorobacter sp. TaxID=2911007 RepID=UPI00256C3B82|nr:hybrid sensor histidine kinase/response regulator [Trichlorobacter sp.]MDK9718824.1 hybrid sensor histidine kinase/response regulator [Trichlorobacter sp.]